MIFFKYIYIKVKHIQDLQQGFKPFPVYSLFSIQSMEF